MTTLADEKTGLGNYFVANYPPFSFWKPEHLPAFRSVLQAPPRSGAPLGLYLHIPFCRKRCKFCYFRVYTDKNAREVEAYSNALAGEVELYSRLPCAGGRPLQFVYFGGGTPSYLSAAQLRDLVERIKNCCPWDEVQEVTFECEPGTLQQHKLETLKGLGVTRLSLGIENFDDQILEANGRAHLSAEILRAYSWAEQIGFDQVNIDLIAGMVGETWDKWRQTVRKTIDLSPDSVTIYQMELPFNTVFSQELRQVNQAEAGTLAVADWPTKRAWVAYAFEELQSAGYEVSSAYTVVKSRSRTRFIYRDSLWHGADMFGTGVASFGHVSGVHMQNVDTWEKYLDLLNRGELPLGRALPVQPQEELIREMILQIKTGRLNIPYFNSKFGVDIGRVYEKEFGRLESQGLLTITPEVINLTPAGLYQIDRQLPEFFLPEHRHARYT